MPVDQYKNQTLVMIRTQFWILSRMEKGFHIKLEKTVLNLSRLVISFGDNYLCSLKKSQSKIFSQSPISALTNT